MSELKLGVDQVPKKKKRKRKKDPYLLIPGVTKIILSELTQKLLGIIPGETVTTESPWMMVKKAQILENLEVHEELSEFFAIRKEIRKYVGEELLMGYVADESKDEEEFYVCFTNQAYGILTEVIRRLKKQLDQRLKNSIYRTIKDWTSMGSEIEVDEAMFKNNRPLIEVEIEALYPLNPLKIQFDLVPAEKRRDGYMELKLSETERIVNVYKRRINTYVQVAPQCREIEVQTTCTYPTNAATQYEYVVENTEALLAKCIKPINNYVAENMGTITDMVQVNGAINFYTEDYLSLIKDDEKFVNASVAEEVKEYLSFMDVNLCKGKMIADVVFHPMWTGTVAVAYTDEAPFIYKAGADTSDPVSRIIKGINPVLIWSCVDSLKPKLILQTPREIVKLSFCKYDENVLIGGMKNGQIIIWDIRNKLEQVEEIPVLTNDQYKYRKYMNSLMYWIKNIHDASIVRPTAVSDLKYSHKGPITGINWLSPFYEYTKLGKLFKIPDDADPPTSMQFLTGGEDGFIFIWDLIKVTQVATGGFKPRKLKRLKKRPSALMSDVSPLSIHHMNLRPLYKIIVPRQRKKPLSMASCSEKLCPMEYEEVNPPPRSKKPIPFHERIYYKPILDKTLYDPVKPQIQIGSNEGDYVHCKWIGADFDSGEVINSEIGEIMSRGRYHDGPLNTCQKNPIHDVTLTVGGRVFALWKEGLKDRPIIWRRIRQLYTSGEWNTTEPFTFTNKVNNGDIETWNISYDSKHPAFTKTFSSGYLSASAFHSIKLRKQIYAAGDKLGSLRLYFLPEDAAPGTPEEKNEKFSQFLEREVLRKNRFLKWQANWNEKRERELLLLQKAAEELEEEVVKEPVFTKPEPEEGAEKNPKKDKKGSQAAKFIENMIRQRQLQEEAAIKATIYAKKQLDTKELEKRRKPLQKLEEENERKRRKQRQRLKDGENIFIETVASLFPDIAKEKPPPPPDPYMPQISDKIYYTPIHEDFKEIRKESEEFVAGNPYLYEFNWKKLIFSGRARRHVLSDPFGEKQRFMKLRAERPGKRSKVQRQPIVEEPKPKATPATSEPEPGTDEEFGKK